MFFRPRSKPRCDCGRVLQGAGPRCACCKRRGDDARPTAALELATRLGTYRCGGMTSRTA